MNPIISHLRTQLKDNVDENTQKSFQRFFKETVEMYGVKASVVTKINKDVFNQIKDLSKTEIFALCEELYKSNYGEEAWIAADWAYKVHKQYQPEDIEIFEHWINSYINDWAKCDTLCNHAVGELVTMYPQLIDRLKVWAHSPNRWVKRASAVTLIIPAKEGKFLNHIYEIATILLEDKEDMVQKGYGWMLKEASRKHQQEVFDFVCKHKSIMPRTALRYAIEKMPQELRKKAMER